MNNHIFKEEKMSKKILMIMSGLLIAAVLLAACQPAAPAATEAPAAPVLTEAACRPGSHGSSCSSRSPG